MQQETPAVKTSHQLTLWRDRSELYRRLASDIRLFYDRIPP